MMKPWHLHFDGKAARRVVAVAALGLATLLGGCVHEAVLDRLQLKPGAIIVERRPHPDYERLFPYYVELCAAS